MNNETNRTLLGCAFLGSSIFVDGAVGWVLFAIGAILLLVDIK